MSKFLKAPTELDVITKTYDLILWSCNHLAKFPRTFRFTLGERLEGRLYGLLDLLLRAKYSRDRSALLREANMELELLRFQFRLAKDLRCLSIDSFGFAARSVNESGKLVGGWIKQSEGAGHEATRQPLAARDKLRKPASGGTPGEPRQA